MNTAMVKGILIGGLVTVGITAGGMVGYQAYTQPKYAEVLAVKPVTETVKQAREECRDVAVQRKAPVKDENRIAGTVIGGVIGGALGSTIGGGRGQTVATVAGAAAGGLIAGIFQLKNYVVGGCPGFLALLFFLPPDGSMGNMIVALASGIVAVVVAFIACTVILKKAYKEDV